MSDTMPACPDIALSFNIEGRVRALEFLITTVLADALSAQPDRRALTAFELFNVNRAQEAMDRAEVVSETERMALLAFANALMDRTQEVAQMTAELTGGSGQAS